jgi:hypothetical protein
MNKIKSIRTFVLNDEGEPQLIVHEERDQLGNVTKLEHYDYDGVLESKTEFAFDDKGRLIEEKQFSKADTPDQTIKIEYNESGKPGLVRVLFADGSVSKKTYVRDEAERTTTINIVDQDGDEEGKEFRRFDDEGRLLEEVIYNDFGNVESKQEYEYDEYGHIVESVEVDSEGYEKVRFYDYYRDDKARIVKIDMLNEDEKIIRIDTFDLDDRGNRVKHQMHNVERGTVYVDLRDYDEKDNEIRFERLLGERPIEVVETKFREDGFLKERESRSGDGVIKHRFEYELY